MKRIWIIPILLCAQNVIAQTSPELRLNLYTSYVFDDRIGSHYSSTSYYDGTVNASVKWGLGAEYMIHEVIGIELSYLRQKTTAPTTYYQDNGIGDPVKSKEFDLDVSYIMIGPTIYFPTKPTVEPYFGFHLGAGTVNVSNPTNGEERKATKFGYSIKGGTNIWPWKKVGFRLQADITSLAQAVGGDIYFGESNIDPGLATYVSTLQFALGGGVVFRFGKKPR